jgi:hypothetical protein
MPARLHVDCELHAATGVPQPDVAIRCGGISSWMHAHAFRIERPPNHRRKMLHQSLQCEDVTPRPLAGNCPRLRVRPQTIVEMVR